MNAPIDIDSPAYKVADLGRWAPSGDNMQTWRFEIAAPDHLVVHAYDTRDHCVYDRDGHPSQIAVGALLETIAVAATGLGLRADITRRPLTQPEPGCDDLTPLQLVFDVRLVAAPGLAADPLISAIKVRTVQRRPMRTQPLSSEHKRILEAAVGAGYRVSWIEGAGPKWKAAKLMYQNARLRLTMPEAFTTHRDIIHWGVKESPDRVPAGALGVDPGTLMLMKWAMGSWRRMSTVNTLMGTWAPRLQMDLLPGMACAAHFVLKAEREPKSIDDYVAAGRALQRFWLTLTNLGLFMQPEMTPLIFSKYVRENNMKFTAQSGLQDYARKLARQAAELVFTDALHPVYMGRMGYGPAPQTRSVRRDMDELLKR